ncbi:MAG: hypothetical protein A2Y10_08745 [Planctomycetes bacterium GWF2_41_51]|nr:MAG: hypothetical protein A2Y10_08745 [Planctomycetes bacterium GWF2_41_51]HBG28357.1 DNA modification methylase [Phycisphaerales bacterium]
MSDKYDKILQTRLESYIKDDKDYWSFRGKAAREHAHAYFQYPAMMVPQMQGQLMSIMKEVVPNIKKVLDPFVGSGTSMTEAMLQDFDFVGQDVNPFAYLLCKVKSGPFFINKIDSKVQLINERIDRYKSLKIEANFAGLNKWFQPNVSIELSQIKKAIKNESSTWARRFFWIALAETIRLTSNCRTSTFKLHIRPKEEIEKRNISAKNTFKDILYRNIDRFSKIYELLCQKKLLRNGHYKRQIDLNIGNTAAEIINGEESDLLITSPPYGDNRTTVPYGQYSYLPLQWIPSCDITPKLAATYLKTTSEIDRQSLGGIQKDAISKSRYLCNVSSTFERAMNKLENDPLDCQARLASFCTDIDSSIKVITDSLKPNSYMIWILGNRRIANKNIPLDTILSELLTEKGAKLIANLKRKILNKRSANKNNTTSTIGSESILVFRKTA